MAISMLQPLPVGNATRVFINPGAGWRHWRVLRRTADAFTGADDTGAVVVADHSTDNVVLDACSLVNGTEYFYRDYGWNGSAWIDGGASLSATPDATYADPSPDAQSIVRERIELGLAVEIARGNLAPNSGEIHVLTAPFGLPGIPFPAVSVHHDTTAPADRFVGEELGAIGEDPWETEGWLARTSLSIVGVSLNSDERIALRLAIARVVKGNLPVFAAMGLAQIEFSQTDTEQFVENNAPLYYTNGSFVCIAPSVITAPVPVITDVNVFPSVGSDILHG